MEDKIKKLLSEVGELSYEKVELIWQEAQKELLNKVDVKMEINRRDTGDYVLDIIDFKCLKDSYNNKK